MSKNLHQFRLNFLGANTWAQRKDGVPLYLLDKLSPAEIKTAEQELIRSLGPGDTWPVLGLGHIHSTNALPALYKLLEETDRGMKVTIASAIFQICNDPKMVTVVLAELPCINSQFELIDLLYLLPAFKEERITAVLNEYRSHPDYLVAYNATRAMGLPTEEVVKRARQQNEKKEL